MDAAAEATASGRRKPEALDAKLLLLTALIIAVCGLVYELLAGTLASYLLGDSVMQFSTVIGLYLSAMGLGSWLSGKLETQVARRFVEVELGVALLGGLSAPALFLAFAHLSFFRLVLYGLVAGVIVTILAVVVLTLVGESSRRPAAARAAQSEPAPRGSSGVPSPVVVTAAAQPPRPPDAPALQS